MRNSHEGHASASTEGHALASPEGHAFALSFCLPGLGQAYQKRWAVALGFFALFALAIERKLSPWCLPVIALAAAFEAFRSQKKRGTPEIAPSEATRRRWAFASVAVAGGVAWLFFCLMTWLPFRSSSMVLPEGVLSLASWIRNCRHALGHVPASLDECKAAPISPRRSDLWGRDLDYRPDDNGKGDGFLLRSNGPNGIPGDIDDVSYRFR